MKLAITLNCKDQPLTHTTNKTTALDMWEAIEEAYEGTGTVLAYHAVNKWRTITYEDYDSFEKFIIAFRLAISDLDKLDMSSNPKHNPLVFISTVNKKFPIWAERQRANLRLTIDAAGSKTTRYTINPEITLEALIADLTDENRLHEKEKDTMRGAILYGNKSKDNPVRGVCTHCGDPKPRHSPNNCFSNSMNENKRQEWEKANGKKWIPWKEYNNKGSGREKPKENYSDDEIFGNVALYSI